MLRLASVTAMLLMILSGLGQSAPLNGSRAFSKKISGQDEYEFSDVFQGGQRACVLVKGDHKPPVDLKLTVHDGEGKLVGQDVGDFAAVIWYPPRDGTYTIRIFNPGYEPPEPGDPIYTECYIAVK
jgi:hypothetical protein